MYHLGTICVSPSVQSSTLLFKSRIWVFENYTIPYLIGTAEVENIKSQHVLEHCEFQLIDTKSLLVPVSGQTYDFKYYRLL